MKKKKEPTGKLFRIAAVAAVLAVPLWLTGCGRTIVYEGGENYPYKIKEKANGKLEISLDGSYSPEYEWQYEQPERVEYGQTDIDGNELEPYVEEAPVELVQKKQEKNGRIKIVVKPLAERSSYILNIVRRLKGTEEPTVSYNSAGLEEYTGVDDVTDDFSVCFSVEPDEKGKLLCKVINIENVEMQGVNYMAEESDYPFYYEVQDDLFQLSLPNIDEWEYSLENTADGTPEEMEEARKERIARAQQRMLDDPAWDFDFSQFEDQEYAEELKKLKEEREAYIMDESNWADFGTEQSVAEAEQEGQETEPEEEEPLWYEDPSYHVTLLEHGINQTTDRDEVILEGVSVGTTHLTATRLEDEFTVELDLKVDTSGNITVENVTYTGQKQTSAAK